MTESDVIDLVFGGLDYLAPGDDALTRRMVEPVSLPSDAVIVDVGCGTGRQSLVVAETLGRPVHALDTHAPFLRTLDQRASERGVGPLIHTHALDMSELASHWPHIDLLCAEGSAYAIGLETAMRDWRLLLLPEGSLVISELCWLTDQPAARARDFFGADYPDMRSRDAVLELAGECGYAVRDAELLPASAWSDYYGPLGHRAESLLQHDEEMVRGFAAGIIEERSVHESCADDYGYLLMRLQPRL